MRELKSILAAIQAIAPAVIKTTVTGSTVDLAGYDGATVDISFGAYTDGTHTFALNESSDGTTWSAVAAADMIGAMPVVSTNAQQNSVVRVGYIGKLRYLQVVNTVTGSPVTGAAMGVNVTTGFPAHAV